MRNQLGQLSHSQNNSLYFRSHCVFLPPINSNSSATNILSAEGQKLQRKKISIFFLDPLWLCETPNKSQASARLRYANTLTNTQAAEIPP